MGVVEVVGVGDDGPDGLSPKIMRRIAEADLLLGAERLLSYFPDVRARTVPIKANLDDIVRTIDLASEDMIVVLASGDPNFFGIAKRLVAALGKDRVEIVPNVSAMQLAFARIKESWDDARVYSAHGRGIRDLVDVVRSSRKLAVLTDPTNTPSAMARELLVAGLADVRAFVCENLGSQRERVTEGRLDELVDREFSSLNVLVLINERAGTASPKWTIGIPDDEFHQRKPLRGLITKSEVRVVSLAKLGLREDSLVWDVGAGSGAVSVEASLMARRGRVFAVERRAEDVAIIRDNLEKFGIGNVTIVLGFAPEALGELPNPDAVFVGGSGGKLREIVAAAGKRLGPGGRIVVNLTTIENLSIAAAALPAEGFSFDVTQVAVARGKAVGGLTRFEGLDPVFVVSGWKMSEQVLNGG
ncbi:MAG: precorrin-6y C5,15-methyltransferase (decarboxylating) subunit CbiE [Chloroflexi bacterium]|nr:precorrin-6y C5,15-methyltransferase (decarboxylating) subunit CbiE [Chloroflexota bacterium]